MIGWTILKSYVLIFYVWVILSLRSYTNILTLKFSIAQHPSHPSYDDLNLHKKGRPKWWYELHGSPPHWLHYEVMESGLGVLSSQGRRLVWEWRDCWFTVCSAILDSQGWDILRRKQVNGCLIGWGGRSLEEEHEQEQDFVHMEIGKGWQLLFIVY